jgi:NAD(P)-dependent dehydrogenase (short-subunit alcohol dehydrogenase family)
MRLKDKVAIITGAAAGMGAATARLFAREGAKLILTDIDDTDGLAVTADIVRANGDARFERHDVSKEADWQRVVDSALAAYGRIDVLVNNAGVSGSIPDKLDLEMWDRQMSINARGSFLGLRAVIPIMQRQKAGAIVNISSISGVVGQDYVHMGYNAAKGAVRTMTKAAAVQYAPDGIRINSVHPGFMPPMRTSKLTADPELRRRLLGSIPMGRTGEVDEVAYANLFLASDEASYITGVELIVDGGFTAA